MRGVVTNTRWSETPDTARDGDKEALDFLAGGRLMLYSATGTVPGFKVRQKEGMAGREDRFVPRNRSSRFLTVLRKENEWSPGNPEPDRLPDLLSETLGAHIFFMGSSVGHT